jgi:hypothetical protein
MRQIRVVTLSLLLMLLSVSLFGQAQQTAAANSDAVVPPLVRFSGTLTDPNGKPLTNVVGVTFSLYSEQKGGAPLWLETQNVTADNNGHYTVMLGSTTSAGLPADIFVAGEARWIAVQVEGLAEQPRVLLLSVPYALKAGDAQTLGGLPASAFVLAAPSAVSTNSVISAAAVSPSDSSRTTSDVTTSGGTVNTLPLFTTASDVQSSIVTQTGSGTTGKIGINTTTPATTLDVNGSATVRGILTSSALGTATAAKGFNSQPQDFVASVFNSSTATAVSQKFQWQAEAVNNDTSTASGTMNLLYASGTATPAETGLKISSHGLLTFAAGQTFPGTSSITGITAGTDLTGGGTGGTVTLNLNTAATNALYARLNANNTFTGTQTINNATIISGSNAAGILQVTNTASGTVPAVLGTSTSASGYGLYGTSPNVGVYGSGTGAGSIGLDGHGTFQGAKGISTATTGAAQGVYGQSASSAGYGVEGTSPFVGVYGTGATAGVTGSTTAAGGYGVIGSTVSSLGAGVLGSSSNPNSYGVYGQVNAGSGSSAGVFGANTSTGSGYGVQGSGGIIGVYGTATGASSYGVEGSSPNVGIFGNGTGSGSIGVDGHGTFIGAKGIATTTSGAAMGVYGQTSSTAGFGVKGAGPQVGVYGVSASASSVSSSLTVWGGVWGDTGGALTGFPGTGPVGILGTADNSVAGYFANNSSVFNTGAFVNYGSGGSCGGCDVIVLSTSGGSVDSGKCTINVNGDVGCTGKVGADAAVDGGTRKVSLYAVQSPENWFEDFGSAKLVNGAATIALDPTFTQTVNTTNDYHVFLIPRGDCEGLYVANLTPAGFEVRELHHGSSNVAFDYRIVAKRVGFENVRLADVTEKYRKLENQQVHLDRTAPPRAQRSAAETGTPVGVTRQR